MLRYAAAFVTAAYVKVRLISQALRALPPDLFAKPPRSEDPGLTPGLMNFRFFSMVPDITGQNRGGPSRKNATAFFLRLGSPGALR